MADRVGVIDKGELILVEDKRTLMHKLGRKQLILHLQSPLTVLPPSLARLGLVLAADAMSLSLTFDADRERPPVATILRTLEDNGIAYRDLETRQSSLEEIFVNLVQGPRA